MASLLKNVVKDPPYALFAIPGLPDIPMWWCNSCTAYLRKESTPVINIRSGWSAGLNTDWTAPHSITDTVQEESLLDRRWAKHGLIAG